jgi:predicted transposase/invertase (TIGR01784 family)
MIVENRGYMKKGVNKAAKKCVKKEAQTEAKIDLLSPCSDYIFKNVFGKKSHKRALISLINAILDGNPVIKDVTLENSEIPKDLIKGRSVRLDIRATTDDSTKINIEMQCSSDGRIINRSAFYHSRMMPENLKKNQEFDKLPNMISIWFTNYDETKRKYHTHEALHTFKATPLDVAEVATYKFRTFIIELPKVDIKQAKISDMFKVWVHFLLNPKEIPPEFLTIPEVEEAMTELRRVSQSVKARKIYNERMRWQDDEYNARAHHYNKGIMEGREEGLMEGEARGIMKGRMEGLMEGEARGEARRMEDRKTSARKLLAKGTIVADIAEITGLSEEEIKRLMH